VTDTAIADVVIRWFPAVFFTFVAVFYTFRILWLHRAGATRRVDMRNEDGSVCVAHIAFRVLRVAIWLAAVTRAVYPPFDLVLLPIPFMAEPAAMLLGNGLLALAFIWILIVHTAMGESWRSGIAQDAPAPLVTTGIFAWSRNPTFLGVLAGQIGFLLAVPSLFSLLCLALGIWAIGLRVRKEETFLLGRHGEAYVSYCRSVPRWVAIFATDREPATGIDTVNGANTR